MKALRSQFARTARENDRARLKELRAAIAAARALKKQRVKSVRAAARLGVLGARRSLLELRQALRDAQRAASRVSRYVVPGAAASGAATVAAELAKHESRLRAAMLTLAEERKYRAAPKAAGQASRAERVEESDTHVKGDIPPELVPAWEKVKRSIHATARRSRAEVFLEWAHDNPEDAARYAWESDEKAAAALAREERDLSREVAKGSKYRGTVRELAAVVHERPGPTTALDLVAAGAAKAGVSWSIGKAARELSRWDFIALYVARATSTASGRKFSEDWRVIPWPGGWVYQMGKQAPSPVVDSHRLFENIRRTPLNAYVKQAEDLRVDIMSEASGLPPEAYAAAAVPF